MVYLVSTKNVYSHKVYNNKYSGRNVSNHNNNLLFNANHRDTLSTMYVMGTIKYDLI